MRLWALVPAKGFVAGKSRLDTALDAPSRGALARRLLEGVLDAVRGSGAVDGTLVVTSDAEVVEVARAAGAVTSPDPEGKRGLAAVVDAGLLALEARGAEGALVLMGDLPQLVSDDVRALADALEGAEMVIGPDHLEMGTNALGLRPPTRVGTCFGNVDSFHRHVAAAREAGLAFRIVRREGVARDLDTPEDLRALEPGS